MPFIHLTVCVIINFSDLKLHIILQCHVVLNFGYVVIDINSV